MLRGAVGAAALAGVSRLAPIRADMAMAAVAGGPPATDTEGVISDLHYGGGVGANLATTEADLYSGAVPKVRYFTPGDLVNIGTEASQRQGVVAFRTRLEQNTGIPNQLEGGFGNHEEADDNVGDGIALMQRDYGPAEGQRLIPPQTPLTDAYRPSLWRYIWISPRQKQADNTTCVFWPEQLAWLDAELAKIPPGEVVPPWTVLDMHSMPKGSIKSTAADGHSIYDPKTGAVIEASSLDQPWYTVTEPATHTDNAFRALVAKHKCITLITGGHLHPKITTQKLVNWGLFGSSYVPTVCCPAILRTPASIYVNRRSWGMNLWLRDHAAATWTLLAQPALRST
jgi:hypothetical protein